MKKIIFTLILILLSASTSFAAQLETQVVKIGSQTLPKNAVRVPFLQLNLGATGGTIEIKSLTISRTGLSTNEDFGRIWAETDHYRRSTSRQLSNDDQVELEFRTPLLIEAGQTERLTIYANLEFEGGGRTAALNLVNIDHNGSDAETDNNKTSTASDNINVKQVPVVTESQSTHDRTQFKISCKNQVCRLVPRR